VNFFIDGLDTYLYTSITSRKETSLLLEQLVAQDQEWSSQTAAEEEDENGGQPVSVGDLEWHVLQNKKCAMLFKLTFHQLKVII